MDPAHGDATKRVTVIFNSDQGNDDAPRLVMHRSSCRTKTSQPAKNLWGVAKKKLQSNLPDLPEGEPCTEYKNLIAQAKRCVGFGQEEGAFPEEWDAQLLVDCGRTEDGHRLVLFCPKFLAHSLEEPDELELAMRFILFSMDAIAMHGTYVFVYCCLGLDWTDQRLMEKLRFAYECLPQRYSKNLQNFFILHCTSAFKVQMWTFRFWLSQRLWNKIGYVEGIEDFCNKAHPNSEGAREELRRRFPLMVQRRDAELFEREPPVTFGVALADLCNGFGVDFTDKTTGRWYPRLPPALVFLCEIMEREAADEDFGTMFSANASAVYQIVETVDHGKPFQKDIPSSALWCGLKLFLDCLPTPLLSFEAYEDTVNFGFSAEDKEKQLRFLQDLLHSRLPREMSYVALYVASFLHTLCKTSESKEASREGPPDYTRVPLTFALATKVFTPTFLRPQPMTEAWRRNLSRAYEMVETLLRNAEDDRLWIGRKRTHMQKGTDADMDSSSESDYAGIVASVDDGGPELAEAQPPEANELAEAAKAADGGTTVSELAEGQPTEAKELAEAAVAADGGMTVSKRLSQLFTGSR